MALPDARPRKSLVGVSTPRIAPPVPARTLIKEFEAAATELGIKLMPWQRIAARYLTATDGKRWRFRDVVIVVARQNGKTEILLPHIRQRLAMGRRILHTAQNRSLPRETFLRLAAEIGGSDDVVEIRYANGQEVIKMRNGGRYTLVAPRPGARGNAVDDVILDEVREQRSFDLLGAIKPTMTASRSPQVVYLSNAGDEESVVLNDLRRRRDEDPALAYLEWSADPDRAIDDRRGWVQANPAQGITIQEDTLADNLRSLPRHVFETEHLCRWVISTQPRLVSEAAWDRGRAVVGKPLRPSLGISMDVSGRRASAVEAWTQSDGTIAIRVVADVTGEPISIDRFGPDLKTRSIRAGVVGVAFDPWTDAELAKHFKQAKPLTGRDYANASENFVRVIESGRLRWAEADAISDDLAWVARQEQESGVWMAVRARPDRPVTAVLAAIRAVWLASGPKPAAPRIR